MSDTLPPCPWPAMGDFSPMTTAPSGPGISAETQTTCVYHFDKFVKHSGVFGQEAVKERYLCYGLQNHFHNVLVQPFESSSKAEVDKTFRESLLQTGILPVIGGHASVCYIRQL